jgi:hypothetical protein
MDPVTVHFPLRGEWVAANTPAEKIPSHGTDQLGQRYAFDFIQIEDKGNGFKFFRPSFLRYLFLGVQLQDCYGWGAPIYAPFDGTVIVAQDGWPERKRLHFLRDIAIVLLNALRFNPTEPNALQAVAGNYLILRKADTDTYAFLAHASTESIKVHEGDKVHVGQHLANVGHSGNSTAPHLHFQLMDRADLLEAQGVPCCFEQYESLSDYHWQPSYSGIPGKREFIRYVT